MVKTDSMYRPSPRSRYTLCFSSTAVGFLLAASAATGQAGPDDPALLGRIDSLVRREADAGLLSGIILVAQGDRILLQRAYGFASWELRTPNGPATRFGIGSITKVMTETLVGLLVDSGRLELDAPVSRYLGPFPKGPKGGEVTIRQLLSHRSGVPWRVTTELEETLPLHPADIVARVRQTGLLFEPGTEELYSSAGYTCLARVIEILGGRSFEAVLRERIFEPAAMAAATDETGQQLMLQRALPYRLSATAGTVVVASAPYKHLGFLAGAGSVYATADDLLHFVRASRDGVFGAAGRARVADSAGVTWRSWYGRTTGYEASLDFAPAQGLTFVFLSNQLSAANWQVRDQVRNLLLGRNAAAIRRPPPVASPFESPERFVGSYGDPADPVVISVVDGHLFRDTGEFYPIEGGRYYLPSSGFVMRFRRDARGAVDAMMTVRTPGGPEILAPRVAARP
jgi:CubicO group peptidase (beta-lactamase class C family)